MTPASTDLIEHTARFCRRLRAEGLRLGPGDTLDATRALDSVDLVDREERSGGPAVAPPKTYTLP